MLDITAVIPTYNRAPATARAVRSILAQTAPPRQIIVVDDGSTDDTADVIRAFGGTVHYIHQPNQGQATARNLGVGSAQTDWIAFLDSDDEWDPGKLERQAAFVESAGCDVCFHDFRLVDPDGGSTIDSWNAQSSARGGRLSTGPVEYPLAAVVRRADVLFTSTLLLRREVFLDSGGYRREFPRCQDVDLHVRLARRCSFSFIDEPMATKYTGSGVPRDLTYRMRIALMCANARDCRQEGDAAGEALLRRTLVEEWRALAGWQRRRGRLHQAIPSYARCLLAMLQARSTRSQA